MTKSDCYYVIRIGLVKGRGAYFAGYVSGEIFHGHQSGAIQFDSEEQAGLVEGALSQECRVVRVRRKVKP